MRSDDAWRAVAGLGASQHGAFTRRQASSLGLTSLDLRRLAASGLLDEPTPGVLRFVGAPTTWRQRQWIAAAAAGGGFVAAYRAAAHLHALDGFATPPRCPEVLGAPGRRISGLRVRVHQSVHLDPRDMVVVDGIPTTGLARTVVDLAGHLDERRRLRLFDDFERRAPLTWLGMTAERLHRPGQHGTKAVLQLLELRHLGGRVPDSWFERLVEACAALPDLPPWERRFPVVDDRGEVVAEIDLACPVLRLGVEAHSRHFHFGMAAERIDQRRDNRLAALGWDLRYVGWYDTEQPAAVAQMIRSVAHARARLLGVSVPWAA